ncbi:hypothetical protein ADL15_32060 [Actinoplanes awajinensis subsp. mycoplanecinus]|uniref:Uncharacterized protein n=2 Tax=Actinoplanes awajinensis TaxID=135946 RepID=A0A117MPC7_9ACTN|nr:hypothetical protein ADL15_32060 [Actinoplanes awajinensis subsp. mycoplanecinus]
MPRPAPGGIAEPGVVRAARWTALVAFGGVLVQWVMTMVALVARSIADGDFGADPGGLSLLYLVVALVLAVPSLVAWSAVRVSGVRPRPGGLAVLWTLGPAALAGVVFIRAGETPLLVARLHDGDTVLVTLLWLAQAGAVVGISALPITAVCWLAPSARRYLAPFRRPGRAERGQQMISASSVLLGLAAVLVPVAFLLLTTTPTADAVDRVGWAVDRAVIISGGGAVAEVFAFVLVVAARRTRGWTMRAAAYAVTLLGVHTVVFSAVVTWMAVATVGNEDGGDTAMSYTSAALAAHVLAALCHLTAVLMLAMPAVSSWIDARPPADV